jgi:hypothetical protein
MKTDAQYRILLILRQYLKLRKEHLFSDEWHLTYDKLLDVCKSALLMPPSPRSCQECNCVSPAWIWLSKIRREYDLKFPSRLLSYEDVVFSSRCSFFMYGDYKQSRQLLKLNMSDL